MGQLRGVDWVFDVVKMNWPGKVVVLTSSGGYTEGLVAVNSDLWECGVLIICLIFL